MKTANGTTDCQGPVDNSLATTPEGDALFFETHHFLLVKNAIFF